MLDRIFGFSNPGNPRNPLVDRHVLSWKKPCNLSAIPVIAIHIADVSSILSLWTPAVPSCLPLLLPTAGSQDTVQGHKVPIHCSVQIEPPNEAHVGSGYEGYLIWQTQWFGHICLIYIYTYIYICMYVYVYIYIHLYIDMHIVFIFLTAPSAWIMCIFIYIHVFMCFNLLIYVLWPHWFLYSWHLVLEFNLPCLSVTCPVSKISLAIWYTTQNHNRCFWDKVQNWVNAVYMVFIWIYIYKYMYVYVCICVYVYVCM